MHIPKTLLSALLKLYFPYSFLYCSFKVFTHHLPPSFHNPYIFPRTQRLHARMVVSGSYGVNNFLRSLYTYNRKLVSLVSFYSCDSSFSLLINADAIVFAVLAIDIDVSISQSLGFVNNPCIAIPAYWCLR